MESRRENYAKILCEWNYKKNKTSPQNYTAGSSISVWWKCQNNPCGCHEWKAVINSRTCDGSHGCPFCSGKKLCSHNSLLAKYPTICEEWDYEKNEKTPNEYSPGSKVKIWWKCRDDPCGCHEWEAVIYGRTGSQKSGCPFCVNRKLCSHNNLLSKFPIICEEWNYDKNKILPECYPPISGNMVWWKCRNDPCGCHEWEAVIVSRTGKNKSGCPFCLNQQICDHSSLLAKYPTICEEWDFEKNEKSPNQYAPASDVRTWWKCRNDPCGCHSWKSSIKDRVNRETNGCPFCLNRKLCSHNNLLAKFPSICEEWDIEENEKHPQNYPPGSKAKVWWICKIDKCHKWETSIHSRTGKGKTGCPVCNTSKGEKIIYEYLISRGIIVLPQKTFHGCRSQKVLPFDFYLPNLRMAIEFDGEQHFQDIDYFYKDQGTTLEYRIYKDCLKLKYCLKSKIKLLRITYEEIGVIDTILDTAINNNYCDDLFLFNLSKKLSKKTRLLYIEQFKNANDDSFFDNQCFIIPNKRI